MKFEVQHMAVFIEEVILVSSSCVIVVVTL
jgi:hypothetical protein